MGRAAKKAVQRPSSPSEAQADPEEDDAVLDQLPVEGKGKKAKAKKRRPGFEPEEEEEEQEAAPPRKGRAPKKAKKVAAPVEDQEDDPEPDADGDGNAADIDPEIIEMAFKQYRKDYKKLPPADELAAALECDVATAAGLIEKKKSKQKRVTNERRAARVKGYYKGAIAAGYGDIKQSVHDGDYSMALARGTDSIKPILSMSDMLRCAQFVPAQPKFGSYNPEEFQMRLDLMETTLPVDAARELLANADAIFKQAINRSTSVAMGLKSMQMVKASHGLSWLKPIAENMLFSAVAAPPGLVAHAKSEGVLPATEVDAERAKNDKNDAAINLKAYTAKKQIMKEAKEVRAKAKGDRAKAKGNRAEALVA